MRSFTIWLETVGPKSINLWNKIVGLDNTSIIIPAECMTFDSQHGKEDNLLIKYEEEEYSFKIKNNSSTISKVIKNSAWLNFKRVVGSTLRPMKQGETGLCSLKIMFGDRFTLTTDGTKIMLLNTVNGKKIPLYGVPTFMKTNSKLIKRMMIELVKYVGTSKDGELFNDFARISNGQVSNLDILPDTLISNLENGILWFEPGKNITIKYVNGRTFLDFNTHTIGIQQTKEIARVGIKPKWICINTGSEIKKIEPKVFKEFKIGEFFLYDIYIEEIEDTKEELK